MENQNKNNSTPTEDPPIYKHLNAKTQALLRQSNKYKQEQEKAENMSNEQT